MNKQQQQNLKPLLDGVAVIILLVGIFTDAYETTVGLVIALAIWILSKPLLGVLGYEVDEKPKKGKDDQAETSSTDKHRSDGFGRWIKPLIVGVILLFVASSAASAVYYNTGEVREENRSVSGFSQIDLEGRGKVIITQSDNESLRVEAKERILDLVDTHVSGDTLNLEIDTPFWSLGAPWFTDEVVYYLELRDLSQISVSGSGHIISENLISDTLEINTSGSATIDLVLEANALDIKTSGSATIDISGSAESQRLNVSGSGRYRGSDFATKNTQVNISGSGNATVNASDFLEVDISGSGKVEYLGSPSVDQSISGSGSVKSIE